MGLGERIRFLRAFFIFHLSVGTRLAIRRFVPVLGIIFALYYFFKPGFFNPMIAALIHNESLTAGLFSTFIGLSAAGMAVPRIRLGLDGWISHLPVTAQMNRRLAVIAIFAAQIPVLLVLFIFAVFTSIIMGVSPIVYLAGLPLLGLASAQCVLRVKKWKITRPLAVIVCVSSTSWSWPLVFGAFILLLIIDYISGPLSPARRRPKFINAFKGSLLNLTIAWRALRLRIIIPFLFSLITLGGAVLFDSNNDFSPDLTRKVICFGGSLSIVVFYSLFTNLLALRRPPWPWVRSLPWSARDRIALDSLFLIIHTIPLFILIALMNSSALIPIVISLPSLTLYATHVIRRASESRAGAYGRIFFIGALGAITISLIPLISLVFLALIPLLLKWAVDVERSHKVSRWLELYHLAAGDSLSWSK